MCPGFDIMVTEAAARFRSTLLRAQRSNLLNLANGPEIAASLSLLAMTVLLEVVSKILLFTDYL
jgi:hypothetical protein